MSICITDKNGNKCWYDENNLLHNEDGPAVLHTDGSQFWFIHGNRHRLDGPAVQFSGGTEYWYIDDLLHREDGPAVEYHDGHNDGHKYWYYHGEFVDCKSTEEFLQLIKLKVFW